MLKIKKCKRGKRKNQRKIKRTLVLGGVNVDGARSKWSTIVKAVIDSKADLWMMQETKCGPGELKKA